MGALKGDFHFVMSNVFVNNALTRIIGQWWNRLLGAAKEGSFSDQDEMYASHRTSRDYICNMFGIAAWGMVFPVLTVVITQLTNAELAGMFSLAFITATLLMMIGNYGVRTYQVSDIDERHSFADYEVKGVPVSLVMGGRDLENNTMEVMRRDTLEKETRSCDGIEEYVKDLLEEIQANIYKKALDFRNSMITKVDSYNEFKNLLESKGGFFLCHWDGTAETEEKIKADTKATIRCIPFDSPEEEGKDMVTGKPSHRRVLIAKAY